VPQPSNKKPDVEPKTAMKPSDKKPDQEPKIKTKDFKN